MNINQTLKTISATVGIMLAISSTTAQAASFRTNYTQTNGAEGDIWLNSITQNGITFDRFNVVNNAQILFNTPITNRQNGDTSNPEQTGRNNNTGAMKTDKGDTAIAPIAVSGMKDPTGTEIAAYLGNLNLNNIIDTEDQGKFSLNLFFNKIVRNDKTGLDNLYFWERGRNSNLDIQAIDQTGNLIGNLIKLNHAEQTSAGYSIDTTEINSAHTVGNWGITLQQLGVTSLSGLRLTADSSYNGPDFKVVARDVPEPTTIAGLALIASSLLLSRRRQLSKSN